LLKLNICLLPPTLRNAYYFTEYNHILRCSAMYSDKNVPLFPRKLVHPFAEYIIILINIALSTADKLVSTVHELVPICTVNIKYP